MSLLEILDFPFRSRQRRALKDRSTVCRESFVVSLSENSFEKEAACRLWDILVSESLVEDFRPLPDDDFHRIYGLAEEDLDEDIIMRLLKDLNLPLPSKELVDDVGHITSPRLLMHLIRATRKEAEGQNNPGQ